jgi:hypothetical protein
MSSLPNAYEPMQCSFKRKVGLAQCRQYIRDPAKTPEVRNGVEWRNCVSCLKVQTKDKEAIKGGESK